MGGSLDKINDIEKVEKIEKTEQSQMKALIAIREVYEDRIKDIKTSYSEHLHSLKRDKKILVIGVCVLGAFLLGMLLIDLFVGSVGWVRY